MIKEGRKQNRWSATTSWIALLLFVLYISCSLHTDVIHRLTHTQELQSLHSEKNEHDPCHKSIYHHGNNSCAHETHLSKSDKCSECQFSAEHSNYLDYRETAIITIHRNAFEVIAIPIPVADFSIHTSDRAPPVT